MVHIWDNILTDRQTDRQIDRQIDKKTIYFCVTRMNKGVLCLRFSGGGRPVSDAVKGVTP